MLCVWGEKEKGDGVMTFDEIICYRFKHLTPKRYHYHSEDAHAFVFKKLKTFSVIIYRNQNNISLFGRNNTVTHVSLERGAKRLYGYLEMLFGKRSRYLWVLYYEEHEMEHLLKTLIDIDNGIDYVYGKG